MSLIDLKTQSAAALAAYNALKQSLADANAKIANQDTAIADLGTQLAAAQANAVDQAAVDAISADLQKITG